jgi:type II secretory ATPase GspE/PulE/Tfp pilus assembly ATPase PilB-like protein
MAQVSNPPKANDPKKVAQMQQTFEELSALMRYIHEAASFTEAMPRIEEELLRIVNAERMTVYQKGKNDREIVSKYISGSGPKPQQVRVPLNASSIAGYVALSQRPVLISDVAKPELLKKIHPALRFNQSFDKKSGFRTESVIAIPIRFRKVLLGVLQILNRRGGGSFTRQDFYKAELVARHVAQKFKDELQATQGPYEYLIKRGLINADQLQAIEAKAAQTSTAVTKLLVQEVGVAKGELGISLEQYFQVPYMPYDESIKVPTQLLRGISLNYLKQQTWVPIHQGDGEVTILIDDPLNSPLIMEIQRTVPAECYVFKVGFLEDIQKYLSQVDGVEGLSRSASSLVRKLERDTEDDTGIVVDEVADADQYSENESGVITLVNQIIKEASEQRASDIHIEPGRGTDPSVVRIRVDGVCRNLIEVPPSFKQAIISRIKIMAHLDISERRKPQDGKISLRLNGQRTELRVATVPTVNGESAVMRILASGDPLPFEKLSLSKRNYEVLRKSADTPYGLLLVVGPTGSGKTTTLHAVMGYLNTPDKKIWTAEDPVEITQSGLQQVQVQPKIGFNFAAALRSFLRADPDIVMIGEMRDHETAHIGVEASLTGHLVLSTLHTNSAPETVTRLLDLGLDPASFADALLAVLAQRLVRTLCVKCKEEYVVNEQEYETIVRFYGAEFASELNLVPHQTTLFRAKGCQFCGGSGYRGRMGVHELLATSDRMRRLIYQKAAVQDIQALSIEEGMRTLMQDGIQKMLRGYTDLAQIRKVAAG